MVETKTGVFEGLEGNNMVFLTSDGERMICPLKRANRSALEGDLMPTLTDVLKAERARDSAATRAKKLRAQLQLDCEHAHTLEACTGTGPYRRPFRVCTDCGLAEEGDGCGYQILQREPARRRVERNEVDRSQGEFTLAAAARPGVEPEDRTCYGAGVSTGFPPLRENYGYDANGRWGVVPTFYGPACDKIEGYDVTGKRIRRDLRWADCVWTTILVKAKGSGWLVFRYLSNVTINRYPTKAAALADM